MALRRVARRMWPRQGSLSAVWEEWHRQRVNARKTHFNAETFGPIERTKYDLDDAGITGEDNPRSYTVKRPLNGEDGNMNNGTDIRTLDDR